MFSPSAGVSASDWEATPPALRALLEQLINRVAQLEEQKGGSFRNTSKPPSSKCSGLRPKATRSARAVAASAAVRRAILAPAAIDSGWSSRFITMVPRSANTGTLVRLA